MFFSPWAHAAKGKHNRWERDLGRLSVLPKRVRIRCAEDARQWSGRCQVLHHLPFIWTTGITCKTPKNINVSHGTETKLCIIKYPYVIN